MNFKAAIFDMDGVVVDTVPLHYKAWQKMADEYGQPFDFEAYKVKVDGIPRNSGARAILPGFDDKVVEEAASKKQGYFLEFLNQEPIPVYDTTIAFIDDIQARGLKVAVISSSKNAPQILKRIGLFDKLDALVCGDDVKKGKPHPDIFLTAAERIGVEPSACVVFEDAVLGIEAGKRAKMFSVGIDRYNEPERLKDADLLITDVKEVNFDLLNVRLKD